MRSLRETQTAFADAILMGKGGDRLQVYRNNVFISLRQALADVYPVVQRLVGEEFFNQLARRFVREHPSRSGNLHDFGRELGQLLETLPDLTGLPYLPDVAALEWALHEVFHEAEARPFDFSSLSDPENARLPLHPAARLIASRYPILAIWEANQAEDPGVVDLDAGGDWLIVFRDGLETQILRLTPGEFALLGALAQGMTLGEACEAAVAAEPQLDLAAAMGRFVASRFLSEGAQA
jgi:hypothetical protein